MSDMEKANELAKLVTELCMGSGPIAAVDAFFDHAGLEKKMAPALTLALIRIKRAVREETKREIADCIKALEI